jgi:hypothetical protein
MLSLDLYLMASCYAVGISDLAGLPPSSANWRAKRFVYACPILFETDTYAVSRYQACETLQAQSENDIFEDTLLVGGVLCDVIQEETRIRAYLVSPTAPFGFSGGILR